MFLRSPLDTLETLPTEWLVERMRYQRDRRLAASDWAMAPDAPTDKTAWAEYRQALRDLPATWEPAEICEFPLAPGETPPEEQAAQAETPNVEEAPAG